MELKVPVIGAAASNAKETQYLTERGFAQWMEQVLGPSLRSIANTLEATGKRLDIVEKERARTDVYVHLDKGIKIDSTD